MKGFQGGNTESEKNKQQLVTRADKIQVGGARTALGAPPSRPAPVSLDPRRPETFGRPKGRGQETRAQRGGWRRKGCARRAGRACARRGRAGAALAQSQNCPANS
jgi:hypothetical protein